LSEGPAVLEEIRYEAILNDEGKRLGWAPSKEDRPRFERGSAMKGTGHGTIAAMPRSEEPARPLRDLLRELDKWCFLDDRLEEQFTEVYGRDPLYATRLTANAVEGARSGSLQSPDAYLASRLKRKK
jgi:hypothetical protein